MPTTITSLEDLLARSEPKVGHLPDTIGAFDLPRTGAGHSRVCIVLAGPNAEATALQVAQIVFAKNQQAKEQLARSVATTPRSHLQLVN